MKTGDPTTIQTEARELLAAEYEAENRPLAANFVREGNDHGDDDKRAIRAITTALNLRDEAANRVQAAGEDHLRDEGMNADKQFVEWCRGMAEAIRALGKDES